ncbi:hypothetical protein BELL_0603g00030 [Botrytis elliptica]|uniref:Carboxylic ester hydrolase n=1 Tax=Botrytis elliptica TaxID=278938 RepID=A0A4Z1JCA6_9HELO|nr:hypothetical protein BELL_0603g00030 [Botrytis elliptica]
MNWTAWRMVSSLAKTKCTGKDYVGSPRPLGQQWLQLFAAKDPEKDLTKLSRDENNRLARFASQQYKSIANTSDPDLTKFRDARGKLITYHGLDRNLPLFVMTVINSVMKQSDKIITYKSTEQHHKFVPLISPDIRDFYHYFEVPGKKHCYGSAGGEPTAIFRQLQSWVENGTVPESSPIDVPVSEDTHKCICAPTRKRHCSIPTSCGNLALEEC